MRGTPGVVDGEVAFDVARLRAAGAKQASLDGEIGTLRETLRTISMGIEALEEDRLKTGALVARLCDSIVKALLAQQKLSAQDEGFTWLRGHFDRMLRELGYGEEREA